MRFFRHNTQHLEKTNPWIMTWLSSQKVDPKNLQQRLFINRQQFLDIKVNGRPLLEGLPLEHFYREWSDIEHPKTSATLVIGSNIGCGLSYVLSKTPPEHKLIVIEPRADMLYACLMGADYTPFIRQKKLFFCPPDPDLVRKILRQLDMQFFFGRIYLRTDIPSLQISPEYDRWKTLLQELLLCFEMEMSTLYNKQNTMIENELENYRQIIASGDITQLKGKGHGLQALLFGAGPSLEQVAPHIPPRSTNILYCAPFQSLPALYRFKIAPHICLALDYTDTLSQIYQNMDPDWCSKSILIYSSKAHPDVIRNYPGPKLPFWASGGISTCLRKYLPNCLEVGSNVLVALVSLLEFFAIKNITLIGADLGYPGQTTHSPGHHQQRTLDPKDPNLLYVKNAFNQQVLTSKPYLLAKTEMEKKIALNRLTVHQFHAGGLTLAGADIITTPEGLLTVLQENRQSRELSDFLRLLSASCKAPGHPLPRPTGRKLITELKTARKTLNKSFRKYQNEQTAINQYLRLLRKKILAYPLYKPYLFYELLTLSKFIQVKERYFPKDWPELKQTLLRMQEKILRMDQTLGDPSPAN